MNRTIDRILAEAQGRYLTWDESQSVLDFALGLPARLEVMTAVQEAEATIMAAVTRDVREHCPQCEAHMLLAGMVLEEELREVLRYCVMAMLRMDMEFLEEELLRWLRPLLHKSLERTVVQKMFERLVFQAIAHLPEVPARMMLPYLERTREVLS